MFNFMTCHHPISVSANIFILLDTVMLVVALELVAPAALRSFSKGVKKEGS